MFRFHIATDLFLALWESFAAGEMQRGPEVLTASPCGGGVIVGKFAIKDIWLGFGLDLDTLLDIW